MQTRKILTGLALAIAGGVVAVALYSRFVGPQTRIITARDNTPVNLTGLSSQPGQPVDFTQAAELAVHAVVHVKTEAVPQGQTINPLYEFFYGRQFNPDPQPVIGIGSGVIISDDGYIVTNNHVVDKSQKIFVTLNDKREYEAKLVGADPSTDLALLKISDKGLPYLAYGNSDALRLGEWVLAVGNPYNLTSTVTAGIVSAKGRSLGIIQDQYRLESFIQTDAAVNQGNSGGALVNIRGELVGINTAIISPSGGFAGTAFAVPVSIVRKIVDDLRDFGVVQRAILGVSIQDVDAEIAKKNGLEEVKGVLINGVREDGGAKKAGMQEGDVILAVNDVSVGTSAQLQEQIGKYRPGDKVNISLIRDGKKKQIEVELRNMQGDVRLAEAQGVNRLLGAEFGELSQKDKTSLGVKYGVRINRLVPGKLRDEGIREGFIITQINNKPIYTVNDLNTIVSQIKGGVYIEGIYPNGIIAYYAFGL